MGTFIGGDNIEDLKETLEEGNETGGTDIVISNDDLIKALNGNSFIDFRYLAVDNWIVIKNDLGFLKGFLQLFDTGVSLSFIGAGGENTQLVLNEKK